MTWHVKIIRINEVKKKWNLKNHGIRLELYGGEGVVKSRLRTAQLNHRLKINMPLLRRYLHVTVRVHDAVGLTGLWSAELSDVLVKIKKVGSYEKRGGLRVKKRQCERGGKITWQGNVAALDSVGLSSRLNLACSNSDQVSKRHWQPIETPGISVYNSLILQLIILEYCMAG